MQIRKSQLIVSFIMGLVASAITGGSPIALLIVLGIIGCGSFAWTCLDLNFKLPQTKIGALWRCFENSESPEIPRQAFVLGVGHRRG